MKYKPYDYQTFATNFVLEHPACGLILDMGLGKSVITLTALWSLLLDSFDVGKVLVVAPKRVAENTWPTELKKWEHLDGLTWSLVLGSEKDRRAALQRRAKIYIINRENVTWLVDNYRWDFDTLVIDELSSFKSSKAQRFRALKRVRPRISRVIGLTGTPQPNGLLDLWPQMYLLDMGQRLGRFVGGYRERFFLPDKRNREVIYSYKPKEGAEEKIYELISDICISMKAADYLDMPELVASRVEVQMNAKEQKLYEGFERDMVLDLKDGDLVRSMAKTAKSTSSTTESWMPWRTSSRRQTANRSWWHIGTSTTWSASASGSRSAPSTPRRTSPIGMRVKSLSPSSIPPLPDTASTSRTAVPPSYGLASPGRWSYTSS